MTLLCARHAGASEMCRCSSEGEKCTTPTGESRSTGCNGRPVLGVCGGIGVNVRKVENRRMARM